MTIPRRPRRWLRTSAKSLSVAFVGLCLVSSIALEKGALGFSSITSFGVVGVLVGIPLLLVLTLILLLLVKAMVFAGRKALDRWRRSRAERASVMKDES